MKVFIYFVAYVVALSVAYQIVFQSVLAARDLYQAGVPWYAPINLGVSLLGILGLALYAWLAYPVVDRFENWRKELMK